jgi:hypothetical protein
MTTKVISKALLICLPTLITFGACVRESKESPQARIIPLRSMSQNVEILAGEPEKVGDPYVIRVRELPGNITPPHSHSVDVHLTVLQGTLYFSFGEKFDRAALTELGAGSYAFIPKGSSTFSYTPEQAIVQIHGVGQLDTHYPVVMKILSEPNDEAAFKFKMGDRVIAKRGRGQIRQGWAFGEIIEYKIEGDNGSLFMAQEEDLQRS